MVLNTSGKEVTFTSNIWKQTHGPELPHVDSPNPHFTFLKKIYYFYHFEKYAISSWNQAICYVVIYDIFSSGKLHVLSRQGKYIIYWILTDTAKISYYFYLGASGRFSARWVMSAIVKAGWPSSCMKIIWDLYWKCRSPDDPQSQTYLTEGFLNGEASATHLHQGPQWFVCSWKLEGHGDGR